MQADELLTDAALAQEVLTAMAGLPVPDAAAVENLRRQFELTEQVRATGEPPPILRDARARVDTRQAEPPTSHRETIGPLLVGSKKVFRQFFQPFINEMLRKQVEFNETLLAAVTQMHEQLQQHVRSQELWRRAQEERLARLESARNKEGDKP